MLEGAAGKLLMKQLGIEPEKLAGQIADVLRPIAERLQRIEEKQDRMIAMIDALAVEVESDVRGLEAEDGNARGTGGTPTVA